MRGGIQCPRAQSSQRGESGAQVRCSVPWKGGYWCYGHAGHCPEHLWGGRRRRGWGRGLEGLTPPLGCKLKPAGGEWVTEKPGLLTWSEGGGVECRPQRVTRLCEDAEKPLHTLRGRGS